MKIAVIGMGYVGLPLAVTFAEAGVEVVGIEVDPARCAAINARRRVHRRRVRRSAAGRRLERPAAGVDRLRRHRSLRGRHHLPADAAQRQPRARPDARQAGHRDARAATSGPVSSSASRARPTRVPRATSLRRCSSGDRASRPASTSTSPSRPSGSTPVAPTTRRRPRPRSSAASPRPARPRCSRSTARRSTPSCRSPPPRWPR